MNFLHVQLYMNGFSCVLQDQIASHMCFELGHVGFTQVCMCECQY